jgi:hypothetical protein
MPKGPKGEKRHADVVKNAVLIMKIATGEVDDVTSARVAGRKRSGKARAKSLTPAKRRDIARTAAAARWKKAP